MGRKKWVESASCAMGRIFTVLGIGSTLKNAKFKGDNILISTQVHSTQFDLSQFDLSYSTKRVDLILFDLFHSTHFMQSLLNNSSDGYRLFLKYVIRRIFLNKKYIIQYTLPRAPIYQESVLDNWFHVCFIISYHYRTTGEMP